MKQSDIEQLLPGIFQRTSRPHGPLAALLEVMEALHQPSEDVLARLGELFNPRDSAVCANSSRVQPNYQS